MGQLWFVAALAMLGSNDFEERERGQFLLSASFPVSYQAVASGLSSDDFEVRRRCQLIVSNHNNRLDEEIARLATPEGFVVLPGVCWVPDKYLSWQERDAFIEMARDEGVVNSGTFGKEVERRACLHFIRAWLLRRGDQAKLAAIMREAKANEIAWHNMLPLTTVPDRLDNLPTRER